MNQAEIRTLQTVTGPNTLDEIQQTLDEVWASNPGVPEDIRMAMAIAVAEIGANIIEHAGMGEPIPVRMQVRLLPGEVHVEFTDHGSFAARVDLTRLDPVDDMAETGRGLALAKAVLGSLTYRRNHVGNHWMLVSKRFG
ncbi:MAG: ATP-binding protein [Mycobacterium sp.]|nr:ATP-binding protein [Mycobacterium sp.]